MLQNNEAGAHRINDRKWQNHKFNTQSRFRALVIDDDIDAILPIQRLLNELNLDVTVCSDPLKAKKLICSSNWSVIVLDWILDVTDNAPLVIRQADNFLNKIRKNSIQRALPPCPIISYSVLPESEIYFPSSKYFFHLVHWEKPMTQKLLKSNFLQLLPRLKSN